MYYKACFECPQCGEAFDEVLDGSVCFGEPQCGESVFCECPNCKKFGSFEILAVTIEPEV